MKAIQRIESRARQGSSISPNSIIRSFDHSIIAKARQGFTLIEMRVVIGIIAILIGASIGGFSAMTKKAEKTKAQELVSNVATALTALFQEKGVWPKLLRDNAGKQLDGKTAYVLVAGTTKYFSLTTTADGKELAGLDKFGIVTPWATAALKRAGNNGSESTKVGLQTVRDHILYYALDLNGDGVIKGSEAPDILDTAAGIRATAAVWCIGKSGGEEGKPWKYSKGIRKDDVHSWTVGQTRGID